MKRIIITLCVFLLLGAIVNVTVAWGIAWLEPPNERLSGVSVYGPFERNGAWWITAGGTSSTISLYTSQPFPSQTEAQWFIDLIRRSTGFNDGEPPGWLRYPRIVDADPDGNAFNGRAFIDVGQGWPCLALMHGLDNMIGSGSLGDSLVVVGIEAGQYNQSLTGMPRILPLRPIWPGFAINTFFYAAILWLLFAFPFTVRRWRRIRRGLCAKCAYPIGASDVCTECGASVKRVA